MLYGVFGIPGSGKSFIIFKDFILKRIADGGVVVSNIKLKEGRELENYVYLEKRDMDNLNLNFARIMGNDEQSHDEKKLLIEQMMHLYGKGNITLIVDEAHLYGYRSKSRNDTWADDLISIHRHALGDDCQFDIVLCTQVTSRLNKQIAEQVEVAYLAIPSELRAVKSMLEYKVFSGVDALNKDSTTLRLKRIITKGSPEVFDWYESGYNITGSGSFRKKVYALIVGIILVLMYVAWSFSNLLSGDSSSSAKIPMKSITDKNVTEHNTSSDKNASFALVQHYDIVCRVVPLTFDYTTVKDFMYVITSDKNHKVCYRVYDNV